MNSDTSASTGQVKLSPSELVFLRGDQFAPQAHGLTARVKLLHADVSVAAQELGRSMLAAAILACEASGTISLAVQSRKALLGLRTVAALVAEPQGGPAWPETCLEAGIQSIVRGGQIVVGDLVYRLLAEDASSPWTLPAEIAQRGLHKRGLLEVEETRVLKLLKSRHFRLPEQTAALSARSSLDDVQRLLTNTPTLRPEVWRLLVEQIARGVRRRQEVAESSDD